MFSVTGLILNSRRSQLSPSKLHKLTFLHDNVQRVLETLESDNCNLLWNSQTVGDRDGCLSAAERQPSLSPTVCEFQDSAD